MLSEALLESCERDQLDVVKLLGGRTAADVSYNNSKILNYTNTPLTATCTCCYDHLHIMKYVVETCYADVNLPDMFGNTLLIEA